MLVELFVIFVVSAGDTVSVVEPCEKRGGVCLEYWQSCARGNYDYGLCGRDGNRVCCIAGSILFNTCTLARYRCIIKVYNINDNYNGNDNSNGNRNGNRSGNRNGIV